MSYRILVTGSRDWSDSMSLSKALALEVVPAIEKGLDVVVIHGDCPTGADAITQEVCDANNVPTERHPADWATYGRSAGPVRNKYMVDLGADVCLAFPLLNSRGTLNCMRLAEQAGIPVHNFGEA